MEKTVYIGALTHCYQRTEDHGVVFYKVSDYLLYFTIYCVLARRYKLRVLKLALMADHVHQAVIEEKWGDLSRFVGQVNAKGASVGDTLRPCIQKRRQSGTHMPCLP